MIPLDQASVVTPAYVRNGNPRDPAHQSPPSHVYNAEISKFWTVGSVAHGGYLLSVLTSAVQTHQSLVSSSHLSVAQLTSQFHSATVPGRAQIEVKEVSITKRWTRLDVELWQWTPNPDTKDFTAPEAERKLRIQAHYLVTALPDLPPPGPAAEGVKPGTLNYFCRPCPLLVHPGTVDLKNLTKVPEKLTFHKGMRWKEVETIEGDGSLAWGAWIELSGGEDLRNSAVLLPFFADVAKNGPESLPADQRPGPSWFPTLTLSLDFKAKFPLPPASAKRTFGLYSTTKSIHDGRHDLTVEVWSAPLDLGEGGTAEDGGKWRTEGSRLLGVSTQMALCLPLEVNHARGRKDSSSSDEQQKAKM